MRSILFASAITLLSLQAQAKATETLTLSEGKIFVPVKGSPATAGYGTFTNNSDKEIKLVVTKAEPFKAVEAHQTLEKDGKMAMEKVDTWTIPAKGSLELKAGGNHIMLFDPKREVKVEETIKVRFKQDGKDKEFAFKVVPRVDSSSGEHHHHH